MDPTNNTHKPTQTGTPNRRLRHGHNPQPTTPTKPTGYHNAFAADAQDANNTNPKYRYPGCTRPAPPPSRVISTSRAIRARKYNENVDHGSDADPLQA
jgi:hypothetical protein